MFYYVGKQDYLTLKYVQDVTLNSAWKEGHLLQIHKEIHDEHMNTFLPEQTFSSCHYSTTLTNHLMDGLILMKMKLSYVLPIANSPI